MKHIAFFHPNSLMASRGGYISGNKFVNGIPVGATDNHPTSSHSFNFLTPDDLVANTLILTIHWTYSSPVSVKFRTINQIDGSVIDTQLSSIISPWEIQKVTVTLTGIAIPIQPTTPIAYRINSKQVPCYILGLLVEGLNDP